MTPPRAVQIFSQQFELRKADMEILVSSADHAVRLSEHREGSGQIQYILIILARFFTYFFTSPRRYI